MRREFTSWFPVTEAQLLYCPPVPSTLAPYLLHCLHFWFKGISPFVQALFLQLFLLHLSCPSVTISQLPLLSPPGTLPIQLLLQGLILTPHPN